MDVDLPEVHARSLEHARRSVAGVADDQWDQLSDCDPWTVRELVNHVVTGNYWAAELGSGLTIEAVGDRLDGDVLGTDARHRTAGVVERTGVHLGKVDGHGAHLLFGLPVRDAR